MYKSGAVLFLLLLFSSVCVLAQQRISGVIVEKNTGNPVVFATVQVKNQKSTLTNGSGEFELTVTSLPVTLLITHLNYAGGSFEVKTTDAQLKIELEPQVMTLKEVSVGNPAIAIMQDATNKALKTYNKSNFGKAFLRQIAYEANEPIYLNEIWMDAEWKPYGLIGWHPTEARHLQGKKGISYTNTSFVTFVLSGYLANSFHKKPLLKRVDSLYTFKLAGTYLQDGEEIAKIICTPKRALKEKRFEGAYYVNTVTNNVLKIEGVIKGMFFKSNGPVSIKNKETEFIAQYRLNKQGDNVLDYAVFNSTNRLKMLGLGVQDTDLYSTLYMMDDAHVNQNILEEVSSTINDSNLVKAMTYNEDFWKKNPGIKRTAKEQAAIEILEKNTTLRK
ncbi:carboxypeptidase-like regulatory domain-containing protein [Pedobacter sp. UYP1]|uniref:carboxypeptidase-like regulatory domain-containing protein n=1 Tax=Pedobacter sp. UYP1 TaxID=1756396 RepID=UPI0033921AC2